MSNHLADANRDVDTDNSGKNTLLTWSLIVLAVAIIVGSFLLAPGPEDGEEAFSGADSQIVAAVEETGHSSWVPNMQPKLPGEVESGLFAAQAAIGAGIFGFAMGRLTRRRQHHVVVPDVSSAERT